MGWTDTEAGEALSDDWESVFDDVAYSISWLREQFSSNETRDVIGATQLLIAKDATVHSMAGVLHLMWPSVIDVAADADLASRWNEVDDSFDDEDDGAIRSRRARAASATFAAVTDCARRACDDADSAMCSLARSIEDDGRPSSGALAHMSAALHRLVEWSRMYVESTIGYYVASGYPPNGGMGGGSLAELSEWEQLADLRAQLASVD